MIFKLNLCPENTVLQFIFSDDVSSIAVGISCLIV